METCLVVFLKQSSNMFFFPIVEKIETALLLEMKQFLKDCLGNPDYNPECIKWINESEKRFVMPDYISLAQLWYYLIGERKTKDTKFKQVLG